MSGLSLCREINIEDIGELTARKGSMIKKLTLNKPPQLEDVDERMGQLTDVLEIFNESLNRLREVYFQDLTEDESGGSEGEPEKDWQREQE